MLCYNFSMATQEAIFDEMLEPLVEALTPETARLLSQIQAKPSIQARVDQLAAKCNEGALTDEERAEYENYIRVGNLLALIKAKAKRVLVESSHG
jgi:hypothetical protein